MSRVCVLRVGAMLVAVWLAGACRERASNSAATRVAGVCAKGEVVEGMDVSEHQREIDWSAVSASGRRFVLVRVTHGLTPDRMFARNWEGARAAGLLRGAYHYFSPSRDPIEQAELTAKTLGPLEARDLPPMVDVEQSERRPPEAVSAGLQAYIDRLRTLTGRDPWIYTGRTFWNVRVASRAFARHPLVIAQYDTPCPSLPTGWSDWTLWQYASTGHVAGITTDVDLDRFNGSFDALLAHTAANTRDP